MIRISVTPAAFDALAATLPLGSVAFEPTPEEKSERFIWLDTAVVNRLAALGGPGESYSDVILRLVALETERRPWAAARAEIAAAARRSEAAKERHAVSDPRARVKLWSSLKLRDDHTKESGGRPKTTAAAKASGASRAAIERAQKARQSPVPSGRGRP